jgi:hypothetical protein
MAVVLVLHGMQSGYYRRAPSVRRKLGQPVIDLGADVIRQLHGHVATTVSTPSSS